MSSTDVKSKLGKEDLNAWGGNATKTFARRTSDGGTITIHKIYNFVDILQVYGDGTTPAHATLTDAIVGIEGQECCIELAPGTWPVTANLTIPATITVYLRRGAVFSVSAGVTLTLSGPVIAEESTWYTGAGTVAYTAGGGFYPLVDDLVSTAAGKGSRLVGVTGQSGKNLGDLFDGGKDVPLGCSTLDASGAATIGGSLTVTGAINKNAAFRGALVYLAAASSLASGGSDTVGFASESYDTDSIHDNATNNERLTVPAGVTKVRLSARCLFSVNATGNRWAEIDSSLAESVTMKCAIQVAASTSGTTSLEVVTPTIPVSAGDYFYLRVGHTAGVNINLDNGAGYATWFAMEIIE